MADRKATCISSRAAALLCLSALTIAPGLRAESMGNSDTSRAAMPSVASVGTAAAVVLEGKDLAGLLGEDIANIQMFAVSAGRLVRIPSQVDPKDADGKYILDGAGARNGADPARRLDENDELAFMAADAGERAPQIPEGGVEIEIAGDGAEGRRYAYARPGAESAADTTRRYVSYDTHNDAIYSDVYRIGFSSATPFLVDTLNWYLPREQGWSPDMVDTMKIRHVGKLFGTIPFERNHGDYVSKVVAVREGPVRVIRRTANRVRILWMLRTPEVVIDYIAYRNGFDMNVVIDIPFRIGAFFDAVESIPSIDWNDSETMPALSVRHASLEQGMLVDGSMSDMKRRFNESSDTELTVDSAYGRVTIKLTTEEESPILVAAYLQDDRAALDPPESVPGQYGNVGFRTYNWERLEKKVSHMFFNVSFIPAAAESVSLNTGG